MSRSPTGSWYSPGRTAPERVITNPDRRTINEETARLNMSRSIGRAANIGQSDHQSGLPARDPLQIRIVTEISDFNQNCQPILNPMHVIPDTYRCVVLASRPVGAPTEQNFRLESRPMPTPGDGQLLLQISFLSIDPYMRGRMNAGASYAPGIPIGDTMGGGTIARVVVSHHPSYSVGEWVVSYSGWTEYAISDGKGLEKFDPDGLPPETHLGVFGMPGFTAVMGLLDIGIPRPEETVVVGAATGAVGSVVGQVAKIKGARAVGIAGGPDKCAMALQEFGFDACVDHRSPTFLADLAVAVPAGIDVYFESVGGPVLEAVIPHLNLHARMPVCGMIAHYNDAAPPTGPDHLPRFLGTVLGKGVLVKGFIIDRDYGDRYPEFKTEMAGWLRNGMVKYRHDITDGLEHAPSALIGILEGQNLGKRLVRLAA
jgi:NADPH-dependent curcumin reductase CurA